MNNPRNENDRNETRSEESTQRGSSENTRPAYRTPKVHELGGMEKVKSTWNFGDYKDYYGWWEYY